MNPDTRGPGTEAGTAALITRSYVGLVDRAIADHLEREMTAASSISGSLTAFLGPLGPFMQGGKRTRAQLCWWGYQAALSSRDGSAASLPELDHPAVTAGAALEFFQAAALIHDDIIDRSDQRRGLPTVHRQHEELHAGTGRRGSSERHGEAAAILLGDLSLGWSEQLIQRACAAGNSTRAYPVFCSMRTEVMLGQYLDVLNEALPPSPDASENTRRAEVVLTYKSAKYSAEQPLMLGAALAGGSGDLIESLGAFGLSLGKAFQLRDDVLGVFGDPEVTGKPSGDDLREGKNTVLVAFTCDRLSPDDARWFRSRLGRPGLEDREVDRCRELILGSGALGEVERLILGHTNTAGSLLRDELGGLDPVVETALAALVEKLSRRSS